MEDDQSSLADYLEGGNGEDGESENSLRFNKDPKRQSEPIPEEDNQQEDDAMERAIKKLKFHLGTFGFPEPGNLRSSKRKEVKLRIKCFTTMLKQREKDIEYRQQCDSKYNRLLQDKELYEDKYRKAVKQA